MKRILFYLSVCFGISAPQFSFSQVNSVGFEQIDSLQKCEKRPVLIFLHTSWCTYCVAMKNTTLADAGVVKLLNQKFYFVTMDIEEKRDISFHGHIFRYKPTGTNTGVHQLAEQLGTINGQLAYPALCFLNADYEITYQREGYVRPKELLAVLEKLK
jgi:thioredoxin-related protein